MGQADKDLVVQRRVELMEKEGVRITTGVAVRDIGDLRSSGRFDAVLLATGATVPRDIPLEGRGLQVRVRLRMRERARVWAEWNPPCGGPSPTHPTALPPPPGNLQCACTPDLRTFPQRLWLPV
jgi:hypothetical protein